MIESWSDCKAAIRADLDRYTESHPVMRLPQVRWQIRLRLTEWWCNTRGGPIGSILRWRLQAAGVRLGYTIPINRVGPALRLPHYGTIVIGGDAVVGTYCQILQGVTIGRNALGSPTIDEHVFIGPNATIIGPVHVGRGARILAGAVVTRDVPPGETWGGVPARRVGASSVSYNG